MKSISQSVKRKIVNALLQVEDIFGSQKDFRNTMLFLSEIWDLEKMKSEDTRYTNAYDDIEKHIVQNSDYDYASLFLERLKIHKDHDERLFELINTSFKPKYRRSTEEIERLYLDLDSILINEGFSLVLSDYDLQTNWPVYSVSKKSIEDLFDMHVKENDLKFDVTLSPEGRADRVGSHPRPSGRFALVHNDGWNDYGVKSEFNLWYYEFDIEGELEVRDLIGELKIIHRTNADVAEEIPLSFTSLSKDFCSLGQSIGFYKNLNEVLNPRTFISVLFALKDAAFFPVIMEDFEGNINFKTSLIREDSVERLLREARYIIGDYDMKNIYKFDFIHTLPYSTEPISVKFDFDQSGIFPNRIFAIIGKNGSGKTQLMKSLPFEISKKNEASFRPKVPLFSKVIAISYSPFDSFEIPKKTASFNYVYCGLRGDDRERLSEKGLVNRFHSSWKKVREKDRMSKWRNVLLNFIDESLVNDFILHDEEESLYVDIPRFTRVREVLSSGQSIILYVITEIIANIRFDSLLLFDEPETHLHPNAISQLVNSIYELVQTFQSFCVIATHSPLIIRELPSRSVYIMERVEDSCDVRKIEIESFGENLTALTNIVFGNRSIPAQHKQIIKNLRESGASKENVILLLKSDNIPLSLDARLYIEATFNE